MRIPLNCMQCFKEQGQPSDLLYMAELQDDGLYWMKCPVGHETVACLQQQKFEVLFDLAANAIIDGYYREAISSFTSCVEDFYKFYINIICAKHSINQELFEHTWKIVASQSERQFGAFIFVYLLDNDNCPKLLSNKRVSFRNEVIHKGKIPSRQEAVDYGQEVLDIIVPILSKLKGNERQYVDGAVFRHIKNIRKKIKGNPHISCISYPTAISIVRAECEPQPLLADYLETLSKRRAKIGW